MKPPRKTRLIRPRPSKSAAEVARIGQMEGRLADLERRIAQLEQRPLDNWPANWPKPSAPEPWSDEARCAVCGNRYKDMTNYVCNHPQCPSRITVTCDSSYHPISG